MYRDFYGDARPVAECACYVNAAVKTFDAFHYPFDAEMSLFHPRAVMGIKSDAVVRYRKYEAVFVERAGYFYPFCLSVSHCIDHKLADDA